MPMVTDREAIRKQHQEGAKAIEKYLDEGKNVVYLTLGDSTIYCTYTYLHAILLEDGYESYLVNGIPSFIAASARLNIPLVEWNELLHVVPAVHKTDTEEASEILNAPGSYVLMKSASDMAKVKELLKKSGKDVLCVENCGMETEHVYRGVDEIPDKAGYFSLIIAKDPV